MGRRGAWSMSMVDGWGVQVRSGDVPRAGVRPDTEKSKDMIVMGLRARRLSWRQIGDIMGVSHVAAYKRWRAIPEKARKHYAEAVG